MRRRDGTASQRIELAGLPTTQVGLLARGKPRIFFFFFFSLVF